MCNYLTNKLFRYRYFWVCLILCLCLSGIFAGLTVLFVKLDDNYKYTQHKIYKSINAKVIGYRALNIGCACGCTGVHSRVCRCSFSYTGTILLSYIVKNNTYYDQKKVECGGTADDAIINAKSAYPLNENLKMYYNSQDPENGVVFTIDEIGNYWIGIMLFGMVAGVCFFISVIFFCFDYKSTPLCFSSYEEINETIV